MLPLNLNASIELTKLLEPKFEENKIIAMFREERDKIETRSRECKALLDNTDSVLKKVVNIRQLYHYVAPKAGQLHSECQDIIKERNDLKQSFEQVNSTLTMQEELRSIFKRIPEINAQILSILNNVSQDFSKRQLDKDGVPFDEYYSKFFVDCRRVKELTMQLETCLVSTNVNELLLQLEGIYTLYFEVREELILPTFSRNLQQITIRAARNYCDLFRQTCAFLVRILRNEMQLFHQIFPGTKAEAKSESKAEVARRKSSSSSQSTSGRLFGSCKIKMQSLASFLELICKSFYEHLRPVVIHINHLETLSELYKLIKDSSFPDIQEECCSQTLENLAEDVQERMVFRTEVFIKESITEYKPSSGDLAYPEKLEFIKGGELKDYQSMWYPTVQRAVLALLYLSRVFNKDTFDELAKEIMMACFESLDVASRLIDERHAGTKLEAALFLSKHQSILNDQMQAYGIECDMPEIEGGLRSGISGSGKKTVAMSTTTTTTTI